MKRAAEGCQKKDMLWEAQKDEACSGEGCQNKDMLWEAQKSEACSSGLSK